MLIYCYIYPPEHELAAIKYLVNRLTTYPICEINKRKEYDTIKQILYNNKYDVKILDKITPTNDTQTQGGKKNKFTHVGRQTKFITKLFRNTKLKVSFKTENTRRRILTQKNKHTNFNKFNTNLHVKTVIKNTCDKLAGRFFT